MRVSCFSSASISAILWGVTAISYPRLRYAPAECRYAIVNDAARGRDGYTSDIVLIRTGGVVVVLADLQVIEVEDRDTKTDNRRTKRLSRLRKSFSSASKNL